MYGGDELTIHKTIENIILRSFHNFDVVLPGGEAKDELWALGLVEQINLHFTHNSIQFLV